MQLKRRTAPSADEPGPEMAVVSHRKTNLQVVFWNAQGIGRKYNEFEKMLIDDNIDLACVCESHLSCKSDNLVSRNFNIIRQDRPTHMGGLLSFVRNGIDFKELNLGPTDLLEYLAFLIEGKNPFIIINTYLPGGAKLAQIKSHLKNDLYLLLNQNLPFFLVGDMNARNTSWNCTKNNTAGKILAMTSEELK